MTPDSKKPIIAVAPMMDRTDRHCRYFMRLLAPDIRLYTEMVVAQAIIAGDRTRLLAFDPAEHPVALQLGGSEPSELERAVGIAGGFGYDEFNLNIGCPSDRVKSGRFGACLMLEPARVADCVAAMLAATAQPVTVKTRIGVDDHDDYEFLCRFTEAVAAAGCKTFVVHARKAILSGLSPKQNREIPPLDYDRVYRLKRDFPQLEIVLNGGVTSVAEARVHLHHVDGVMVGRKAYDVPMFIAELQAECLNDKRVHPDARPEPATVIATMADYAERQIADGSRLHHITRHMLGFFNGTPGARRWRRYISERGQSANAGAEVLRNSLEVFAAE